ncbi:hypothetical protein DL769_006131 [Monosporascus sp. CRB-8-3]|nr:hypothetical protein DL769_006131 [Monosporascus sp. CRB-8-3]
MSVRELLGRLGPEIEDPEEETFLLFSQDIPSQNLGFVDSGAALINLTLANKDYTIHQSPTILLQARVESHGYEQLLTYKFCSTSNREGGTTGAVVWKITPLVAEYLAGSENILRSSGVLSSSSSVLELGCGISGLVGLAVAPTVERYVLTDQPYVARLVEKNISENLAVLSPKPSNSTSQKRKGRIPAGRPRASLRFAPLDWEQDKVTARLTGDDAKRSFDVVLACDCIYNEALIQPLVQTCVDVCKLRASDPDAGGPAVCVVAQQLRDPDILEGWIKEFHKHFRTWRIPKEALSEALRLNPGFVIHIGVLRDAT